MNKFISFKTENGLCVKNAEIPLDNQGFVLIHGVNKDEGGSNGAGKSSLFDLLAYTATGRTGRYTGTRNVNKKELLNLANPKNFFTQLVFEKGGSEYIVNNYRAHEEFGTKLELFRDGEDITPTTKLDDVQKDVLKILNYTPEEFYGQVYLCQQFTHAMVQGTPKQKKDYLSLYFGLEDINLACTVTQKTLNGIIIPNEKELEELRASAEQQLAPIPAKEQLEADHKVKDTEKTELQARMIELKFEIEQQKKAKLVEEQGNEWQLELAKRDLTFSVEALKTEKEAKTLLLNRYTTELHKNSEITKTETELRALGVSTDKSYEDIRAQIGSYESTIEEAKRLASQLEERAQKEAQLQGVPKVEQDLKALSISVTNYQTEVDQYTKTLNTLASEIQKLSFKGKECPTCLRPISEEEHSKMLCSRQESHTTLDSAVSEIKAELTKAKDQISFKETSMILEHEIAQLPEGDAVAARQTLKDALDTKSELQKLADAVVKTSSLQNQLKYLQEQRDYTLDLSDAESQVPALREEAQVIGAAIEWLLANGNSKFDMNKLSLAQEAYVSISNKFTKVSEALIQIGTQINNRVQLEKQLADVTKIISKNNEERNRKRILEVINITVNDIKKAKMREATNMLNQVLPYYIKQLFPQGNIGIETPDDGKEFDLFLKKGNQQIPLYLTSGGQGKRVALSIFFAFAKMGAKSSNIIMLDEPYRDLDINGREACYDILQDLAIPSIFITSHDTDQQISKKYNQIWRVEMENNISKLVR